MELVELLLIAIGAIAAAFLLVTIIRRISAYYRQRHQMSVWAGAFMLIIAMVLVAFSLYHYGSLRAPFVIAAGALLLITAFLDMYHAGIGMGVLALLFQLFLAATFAVLIGFFVIYYVIRAIRRGDDLVVDAITGTTSGFRNGVSLFLSFFRL